MPGSYIERRSQIETYFDRTAYDAWSRLTSSVPVSRIRATVRAGRAQMRQTMLAWLPSDLRGSRLLDAGCGTGAFAVEAARRGAQVVAVDLSPTLIALARERTPHDLGRGSIEFLVGDMLDGSLGRFDHVVAMDSLIHYGPRDVLSALSKQCLRTEGSVLFTFAPRTAALSAMHLVGRLLPRGNRAPAIEPVAETRLRALLAAESTLATWRIERTHRVTTGFYISQAMQLVRA